MLFYQRERDLKMKILIVNDDSIYAPGIAELAKAAVQLGTVTVVAPARQCSALSQKLTLRETLPVEQVHDFPVDVEAAWKVDGTPVDCVKVALEYILTEKPDLVLSGINNGYNVGFDIAYSGTLGAAFEAVRSGIPAMAFSTSADKYLDAAQPHLLPVIQMLLEKENEPGTVWNVNFPPMVKRPLQGILWDRKVAPTSLFRENYVEIHQPNGQVHLSCQGRPTPDHEIPAGTDAEAVRLGYISIGKVKSVGF
jgi:5'-nucleotidase